MKKLLSLALLIAVCGVGYYTFTADTTNNKTFTVLAANPGLHFALYSTKNNKRVDKFRPQGERLKAEGEKHGYALNSRTGDRTLSIPQDGSLVLVISRYPDFKPKLQHEDIGLIIDDSTGQFIKAILDPSRSLVSNIRAFNSLAESVPFVDEPLVNPENNITTMEWIRRYNQGQSVPKGKAR